MNHRRRARIIGLSVLCMAAGSFVAKPAFAAPSTSGTSSAPVASCNGDKNVDIFNFNDFHGRIATGANLFTPVVEARNANGADKVLLLDAGDNVGGSTFESGSLNDEPTIDVLNAAGVDANAVGNHEFDKGWKDLAERIVPHLNSPYLGANVYEKGTTKVAAPLKASTIIVKDGVRIGVVGAVTHDLPSLVSPAGISNLTIGDPVKAVNAEAKRLKSEGLADASLPNTTKALPTVPGMPPARAATSHRSTLTRPPMLTSSSTATLTRCTRGRTRPAPRSCRTAPTASTWPR